MALADQGNGLADISLAGVDAKLFVVSEVTAEVVFVSWLEAAA
ncbi:MAG TPA: hypothetical protein VN695_10420 [Streptosporangiaceae bacterium]|nr:hypothetical protein [Streptosporangiaceae bacterium]